MVNRQLSEIFEEMADILEILGADPFRVNSYRKVARVLGDCAEDVAVLSEQGRLRELAGIGKGSAEKIQEFIHTGAIRAHRELQEQIPAGLLELLKVPGLGPKGVRAAWKQLGVSNLAELNAAIAEKRLEQLPGFGPKKVAALAQGIAFVQAGGGRVLLGEALAVAELVVGSLRRLQAVRRIEVAGSLRRACETIGDIDLLVVTDDAQAVVEAFTGLDGVEEVLAAGGTKASIRFGDTAVSSQLIQIDLRVVPAESLGAAWQYFTGSKAHNVRLREIAVKKKLKLNEYGLFKGRERIAGRSESEIYRKLGLAYIPPTLREDRGEVEAAAKKTLPELIELKDLRGDLHVHSPESDGRSPPEELAATARQLKYRYLAITDHSHSSVIAHGLDAKRLLRSVERIRRLNERLKDFTVLAGAEVDIGLDGRLDYPDEVLRELDFVIAAVHSGLRGSREKVTTRVLKALDNPYVNCLAHPTGRMIHQREPMDLDIKRVIEHAAATHTALEVSSSPLRLDLKDMHCRMAVEAGATLVINTDAHDTQGLFTMRYGVATAQRGWVTRQQVLNTQPISAVRRWVKRKRP